MEIERNMYVGEDIINAEIEKDNELLQFMIARISPDEYLEIVRIDMGFQALYNKIIERGGVRYIKGAGFHPCQYGFGKHRACAGFVFACEKHHRCFSERILELYTDKEYVKKCVEKFKR